MTTPSYSAPSPISSRSSASARIPPSALPGKKPKSKTIPSASTNKKGSIVFATAGPNTRTTQVFINLKDNAFLDKTGFAPFGTVDGDGMKVVEMFYDQYGDNAGIDQEQIEKTGKPYLDKSFPKLDVIKSATIICPVPTATPAAKAESHLTNTEGGLDDSQAKARCDSQSIKISQRQRVRGASTCDTCGLALCVARISQTPSQHPSRERCACLRSAAPPLSDPTSRPQLSDLHYNPATMILSSWVRFAPAQDSILVSTMQHKEVGPQHNAPAFKS